MTAFKTIPINLIGPTDQVHSVQQDAQLTQNYYVYLSENGPALQGTPGSQNFSDPVSLAAARGSHVFNEELYVLSGTTLEKVAEDGVRTTIGTIPGSGFSIIRDDGTDMFIVTEGKVYRFNTSLTDVSSGNFESPNGVAYINRQFIYDGTGNRYGVSDVGDGSIIIPDNYGEAESDADKLLRTYVFGERLRLMGAETIEIQWNSGEGSPPFEKVDGAIAQKGLGAVYSVAQTDKFMYFLGDDLNIYQMLGNQVENIASPGISKDINEMSDASDAIGFSFNLEGQDFYYITFATGNKSYLYAEVTGIWSTMTFGVNGDRHLASSYAKVYKKHLFVDRRNGRVLEWKLSLNEDNGEVIQRRRVLARIDGEMLGAPGKRLLMSSIEFQMQKGMGLPSGQGSDPILMIEMSFDGGQSWDTIQNERTGEAGEFDGKVKEDNMHSFYEASARITQSDPVISNIRGASIDLKLAGF